MLSEPLPHSQMRMPEPVPWVREVVHQAPGAPGKGFTAFVNRDSQVLCTITDYGGGPLRITHAPAGAEVVRAYIRECRTTHGQAPTEAEWCEALVYEYDCEEHIECLAGNEHAVRWYDADGDRHLDSVIAPATASDYRIMRAARTDLSDGVRRAEVWLCHSWVSVYDADQPPPNVDGGVVLPHTGLNLPTDQVSLADVQRVELRHTTAAKADVYLGQTLVGTAEQNPCNECEHGDDAGTVLYRAPGFALKDEWDQVIALSRDRYDIPVNENALAWLLLEEHAYEAAIARCDANPGMWLHRLHDSGGRRRRYVHTDTGLADAEAALERAPHLRRPVQAVRAELWTGPNRGWVTYYDATRD